MKNLLNSMLENTMEGTLKHEVVEIIMDQVEGLDNDEILPAVEEIIAQGCQSGIVTALITYSDTEAFFDRHANEIFELVEEAKEEGIINLNDFILCKNDLAWFAFETIAQEIYQELEYAAEF